MLAGRRPVGVDRAIVLLLPTACEGLVEVVVAELDEAEAVRAFCAMLARCCIICCGPTEAVEAADGPTWRRVSEHAHHNNDNNTNTTTQPPTATQRQLCLSHVTHFIHHFNQQKNTSLDSAHHRHYRPFKWLNFPYVKNFYLMIS